MSFFRPVANRKRSLLRQAVAASSVLVVTMLSLLTALFIVTIQTSFQKRSELRAESLSAFLGTEAQLPLLVGDRDALRQLAQNALATEDVVYICLRDNSGAKVAVSRLGFPSARIPAVPDGLVPGARIRVLRELDGGHSVVESVRSVSVGTPFLEWKSPRQAVQVVGTVQAGVSTERQDRSLVRLVEYAIAVAVVAVMLMILVNFLYLRRLLRPLETLTRFTKQVGKGDLDLLAPVERSDEVGDLAAAFNQMVERLRESRDRLVSLLEEAQKANRLKTESEERFRLIAETVEEVLWIADAGTSKILYISPGYERIWGRSRESLLGDSDCWTKSAVAEDRPGLACIFELWKNGQPFEHEWRIARPDGTVRWVWDRGFPVKDELGRATSYVGIARDITERKRVEGELAQTHKLEAIGRLAAGIAHEINTPIQYIGDNARFLESAFEELARFVDRHNPGATESKPGGLDLDYLQGEVPKAVAQLLDGVEHVARIVGAMKEFSHPNRDGKTAIDINHAIQNTVTISRNEWKYCAEVVTRLDPTLPAVCCLAGELNQVFLNLIVNAAHAIADAVNGRQSRGVITIATCRNEAHVEIRVSDTGCGIPDEIRNRVFDPFFTTKEVGRGSGQGLAIAHDVIVHKHQGTITFESVVDQGTTFLIRLPIGDSAAACLQGR